MAKTFRGQLHGKSEQTVIAVARRVGADHQRACPPQLAQPDRRRIGHLRGQDVGQILTGLGVVQMTVVIDNEIQPQFAGIVLWPVSDALGSRHGEVELSGCPRPVHLFVGYLAKMLLRQLAQLGQRQVADKRGLHQVGAVVLFEKRHSGIVQPTLSFVGQRLQVANLKSIGRMIAQKLSRQPVGNAEILLPAHGPLCVDRVLLFVDISRIQERVGKKT